MRNPAAKAAFAGIAATAAKRFMGGRQAQSSSCCYGRKRGSVGCGLVKRRVIGSTTQGSGRCANLGSARMRASPSHMPILSISWRGEVP